MKKYLSLFLALVLVFGCCACAAKTTPDASDKMPSSETASSPTNDNNDKVDEPDVPATAQQEPVTLKFYCYAGEQADQQAVFDKLNEYFQEKYNTTVDFQFIMGSFADKMNVIINSGEEYDACFTSNWTNSYTTNVSKEAFVDISGMLADYPDLYNAMPEACWKAVTINGGIYAVPNVQIAARQPALHFITGQMEELGLTEEDVAGWTSIMDAKDYLYAAYELDGSKFGGVSAAESAEYCGYELLSNVYGCIAVKHDDPTCTVVNYFETEEFKTLCEQMAELNAAGLADGQCAIDGDYLMSQFMANRVSLNISGTAKPGGSAEDSTRYGYPVTLLGMGSPFLTTSGIIATMWGVSTTSKHPDRVMQILELLLTDPYVMNLISYGIEGIHYEVVDGFVQTIGGAGYAPGVSWAFGNVFLTTPQVGQPADVWEQTKTLNETADVSNLIGFNYSNENVQSEITNINSVAKEYIGVISGQMPVEETLAAFLDKLDAAGIDVVIADAQAQVDAFLDK